MNRFSQSTFDRPPKEANSLCHSCAVQSVFLGPLRQQFGFAPECQIAIATTIVCLFRWRGPNTIPRIVVPVVVNPFDRMCARGLRAHVFKKCLKGRSPTIADRNPSTAVPVIRRVVVVAAPLEHLLPRTVFRRLCLAMRRESLDELFSLEAPTTPGSASGESTACNVLDGSTRTLAPPIGGGTSVSEAFEYSPPRKLSPGQVFEGRGATGRIVRSHDGTPDTRLVRTAGQVQLAGRSHFTQTA
jgi:hypothetical protein